ncbi:hypothetical protein ZWY2020_016862 [Hordeum vulgare]|nr:hypothetical protein ZWY2020_016862 [Hordeum vulgare]
MQTLQFSNKTQSKKLHIPSLGLALLLLISLASQASSCTEHEKASLRQFLAALSRDGGLAAAWQDGMDCCKWRGITCSQDSMVTNVMLASKGLEGHISESLGNLPVLQYLNLSHNSLSGGLPLKLVSSSSITILDVSFNQLNGTLHKLPSPTPARPLQVLNISSNLFAGQFPSTTWEAMENLRALNASNNSFTGRIPTYFCNSSPSFAVLDLCLNKFSGNIPQRLGDCSKLRELRAGYNNLSGTLPEELFNATSLECLSFPNNDLHGVLDGEIPTALVDMPMLKSEKAESHLDPWVFELPVYTRPSLQYRVPIAFPKVLDLSNNSFTGEIPLEIGQLKTLLSVNFSFNDLTGHIPQSICNLTNLLVLDLSNNNLTGAIPVALNSLHFLSKFNISSNNLEGPIPSGGQFNTFQNSSFSGNPKLCGSMLHHKCGSASAPQVSTEQQNKKAAFAIAFGVFFGGITILLLLVRLLVSIRVKGLTAKNAMENNSGDMATSFNSTSEQTLVVMPRCKGEECKLRFTDILKATNNFDEKNIVGCGGYGLVYKAELHDGSKLAIKKLNGEMCLVEREFSAEVDALSMAQHENLVPLWGYCIQGNSRLLIYSYMENGSLDDWLHNRDDDASSFLDWPTRLKIAQGASLGLSCIHDVCKPQIVHRDIKSSNILLDKEFKAYVADFGLARLILPNKTHVTTELVGTMGYIPPEYGQAWVATLRGDIYSFGVVLLELLTGRRPVPVSSTTKELVPWVLQMRSEGKQIEVLDSTLQGTGSCREHEKTSLLQFLAGLSRDGNLTASWRNNTDCCTWEGITCSSPNRTVTGVSLASQGLEGSVSPFLGNLTSLLHLNLSCNSLSGGLPLELVSSSSITILDVSFNQLNGALHELASPTPAPPLQVLDLSSNNLTGGIPAALSNLHFLSAFNISNNGLEGPIPFGGQFNTFQNSSFDGNPNLCGSMLTHKCGPGSTPLVPRKQGNKVIFAIAFGVFFGGIAFLLLLGRLLVEIRIKGFTEKSQRENNGGNEETSFYSSLEQTVTVMPQRKVEENKLKFMNIVKATNNFDKENIIGCGGYGLVYKAELPDGSKLAIKKLNSEMFLVEREFRAEVDALSMAQHANLVPLWGYCTQGNSRLLIYSYMENGSLDDWLHNRDDYLKSCLDWPTRLKIAQGASLGLSYIHNVCKPHIVHRDIKSSNILLDKAFKAYVADFGLARLILPNKTHVTTELVGTTGYIPPEYGQAWVATLRGDIYSFGVVLLELLTGRRPVPVLSTSKELVPWVLQMRSEDKQIEILDPTLQGTGYEEQMLKVLETACRCLDHDQFRRPTSKEVVSCLASIDADLQT